MRTFHDPEIAALAALAEKLGLVMVGTYTVTTACSWSGMYNGAEVSLSFSLGTLTPTAQQQYALDNFIVPAGLATNPHGQTGPTATPVTPAPPVTAGWILQADGAGGAAFAAPAGGGGGSRPFTFTATTLSTYTLESWEFLNVATPDVATSVTLPPAPSQGDLVGLFLTGNGPIHLLANTGQTISGQAQTTWDDAGVLDSPTAIFIYLGAGLWAPYALSNTDAGLGITLFGPLSMGGAGINPPGNYAFGALTTEGVLGINAGLGLTQTKNLYNNYTTLPGDTVIRADGAVHKVLTLNTPHYTVPYPQVIFFINDSSSYNTVTPASGTISGQASFIVPPHSSVIIWYDGSANFEILAMFGGDNSALTAAATTITLGAAAQLAQVAQDAELYIQVTAAGQLTVAIGPTSGVANTLLAAAAATAGQLVRVRLPAGWFIAVTSSSTAAWTAVAVTC